LLFFVTLGLCALLTAGLVYRYDLYEHEPVALLALAVGLGAGAMALSGGAEAGVLGRLTTAGPLAVAAVAAFTEEAAKLLVVVAVAVLARREFDDPMDGVVYGSMAGLGMALEESVFYARLSPAKPMLLPVAELVRLWAHVVLGGIVGFPLGFWRTRPRAAAEAAVLALGVAFLLHFGWDALVLSMPEGAAPGAARTLAGIVLMLCSLALYGRLVVLASARSRLELGPLSPRGLWGWPFDRLSRRRSSARASQTPPD
jgi:RsiW-degrading membrane proteinase PrsW (M82 family)